MKETIRGRNNYTTKIAAVQHPLITICADTLAAEWRLK